MMKRIGIAALLAIASPALSFADGQSPSTNESSLAGSSCRCTTDPSGEGKPVLIQTDGTERDCCKNVGWILKGQKITQCVYKTYVQGAAVYVTCRE